MSIEKILLYEIYYDQCYGNLDDGQYIIYCNSIKEKIRMAFAMFCLS